MNLDARIPAWHCTALLAALCLVVSIAALAPARARADGDPASDVLASAPLFLSGDGGFSRAQEVRLSGALARLTGQGLPVRVAVIASPADLGSVTELWGMPSAYARFLGQELADVFHGTLLVAMPSGFGAARIGAGGVVAQPAPPPPRPGSSLAGATLGGLVSLAAADGHHLSLSGLGGGAGAGGSALGSVDLGSWIALGLGALAIAAAWTVSLRSRPVTRLPGRRTAR